MQKDKKIDPAPWSGVDSKKVYTNKWFDVFEDSVIRPDASPGTYNFVTMPDTVGILALDDQKKIVLVRQYRYTVKKYSWEIPAGRIDKGESPISAAKRELLEETGVRAKIWKELGYVHPALGILNSKRYLFFATDLEFGDSAPDETEDIIVRRYPIEKVLLEIDKNMIFDDYTVSALLKYSLGKFKKY